MCALQIAFRQFGLIFCFIFLSFCKSSQKNLEKEKAWVIAEGEAMIYGGDIALSKERALFYAKKNAVSQKLGTLISSKTVSESGIWVKGEILGKSEGIVSEYQILEEKKRGDIYWVKIKCIVSESLLKNTVEEILDSWERPVVFMLGDLKIQEKDLSLSHNYVLETMGNFFQKEGFLVKKVSRFSEKIPNPVVLEKLSFLQEEEDLDFDLLLFVTASCTNAGRVLESALFSAQGLIKAILYDPYTGLMYGNAVKNAAQAHINFETGCAQALQKASEMAFHELKQELLKKWERDFSRGRPIFVEIQGNITYQNFYNLQKEIKEKIRGVEAVIEKTFSDRKVEFLLMFTGKPTDFLEELLQKKFLSLNLSLKSRNGSKIILLAK